MSEIFEKQCMFWLASKERKETQVVFSLPWFLILTSSVQQIKKSSAVCRMSVILLVLGDGGFCEASPCAVLMYM